MILARKVNALKAATAFSGWLFTVVRRECQRLSRKMFGQGMSIEDLADTQLACRSDKSLKIDLVAARESLGHRKMPCQVQGEMWRQVHAEERLNSWVDPARHVHLPGRGWYSSPRQ